MRDEVLSSVGAKDMDTTGYQVSDLDDVEFCWENGQLNVHAILRQGIDTPFHQERLMTWKREVQHKTLFCSTKRRTRSTLLHQNQSLRDQYDPLQS